MPDSILDFFSARFDLPTLLVIPLSPDSRALRAAIGLLAPPDLALLVGCLPLPLSLRGSTTGAFSGYRAVLGTRSLNIPMIWCFITRHVMCFRRWNCMKVDGEYEFGRAFLLPVGKPTNYIGGYHTIRWSYMLGLYTDAARSDPWRHIEMRVLYYSSSVCVLHIKPLFLSVHIQHSQCPCRVFNPRIDTSYVATNLRHRDTTLPRMQ